MALVSLRDQAELIKEVILRKDSEFQKLDAEDGGADINVGHRLHELRKQRKLTLKEASQITGVSASAFSKIERNELSPTIGTLQRIAQGLDIDLMALLGSQGNMVASNGRRSVSRAGDGNSHATFTCQNKLLCSDLRNKRMTPIVTRVTARSPDDYNIWPKSDAEIFLMVLEGTLVIHCKLYEPLELNAGDSMYYDASTEHVWTSTSEEDAKVLWVLVVR